MLASALQRYLPLDPQPAATAPRAPGAAWSPGVLDAELLRDYLDSTRQDLAALVIALGRHDVAGVAREAHRIKGASGLVGADAVADCAARIETAARAQSLAHAQRDVVELAQELQRYVDAHGIAPAP